MEKQLGWTTIEQSKKLIEAGLDLNTADMWYDMLDKCTLYPKINEFYLHDFYYLDREYPCWSLGMLIDLMPQLGRFKEYPRIDRDYKGSYRVMYPANTETRYNKKLDFWGGYSANGYHILIDAVVDVILHLLENNYIKKEETK